MPEQEYYDLEQEVARAQRRQDEEIRGWKDTHQLDLAQDEGVQKPRWFRGHRIVVPSETDLRRRIMDYYHDTPTAGHPGRDKTIQATKRRYWWPGMNRWIEDYVKGCAPCQQNKNLMHRIHPPVYHITPGPQANPFEEIAMDLITQLPKNGPYDAILMIVDHGCTRAAIFLPCSTTITGEGIADLYLNNVYQWFGLPTKMVSDRDPRFTSHFAQALTQRLGVKQNISTAYHLQMDGLSERTNQWVEQYLRFVTTAQQDDWSKWLAIAFLVHNTWINATIKMAPLQALLGYLPRLTAEERTQSPNQRVEDRAKEVTEQRRQARAALALCTQTTPLDQFAPGDQVWLEVKHLKLPYQAPKLAPKHHGPFTITKKVSPVAYQLQLPLAWTIHDVFHASLLTPYHENVTHRPNYTRPPPDLVEGEVEYEVEDIINHRFHGRTQALQYLIHWKGYPDADNSWEPAGQVHTPALIAKYHRKNPLEDSCAHKNPRTRRKISIHLSITHPSACPTSLSLPSKATTRPTPPDKLLVTCLATLPSLLTSTPSAPSETSIKPSSITPL